MRWGGVGHKGGEAGEVDGVGKAVRQSREEERVIEGPLMEPP